MKLICASKVEFKWSQSSPATSQPAVTRYSAASNSPSQTNQQRGEFRSGGVIPIEVASPGLEKKKNTVLKIIGAKDIGKEYENKQQQQQQQKMKKQIKNRLVRVVDN